MLTEIRSNQEVMQKKMDPNRKERKAEMKATQDKMEADQEQLATRLEVKRGTNRVKMIASQERTPG